MQGIELYTEVEKEVHKIFDAMQTLKVRYKMTSLHLECCNGMEQFTWKAVMAWNNSGTARGKVLSNWENAMTGMETKEMKSLKGENDEQRIESL